MLTTIVLAAMVAAIQVISHRLLRAEMAAHAAQYRESFRLYNLIDIETRLDNLDSSLRHAIARLPRTRSKFKRATSRGIGETETPE